MFTEPAIVPPLSPEANRLTIAQPTNQGQPPGLKKIFLFLWPYLTGFPQLTVGLAISVLLVGVSFIGLIKTLGKTIDIGFQEATLPTFYTTLGLVGAWCFLLSLSSAGRVYCSGMLGESIAQQLQNYQLEKYLALDGAFHDKNPAPSLMAELTGNTQAVTTLVSATLPLLLRNGLMILMGLIMMVIVSPSLTLITLLVTPIVVGGILLYGRSLGHHAAKIQTAQSARAATLQDCLTHVKLHQAFVHEAKAAQKFHRSQSRLLHTIESYVQRRAALALVIIMGLFGACTVVILWGAHLVQNGTLSPGNLSAFILYAAGAAGAMGALSDSLGEIHRGANALQAILSLMATPDPAGSPNLPGSTPPQKSPLRSSLLETLHPHKLTFDGCSFAYPARPDQWVLRDFSLTLTLPQKVAIVGPSGGGKSTLFDLLLGFYPLTKGQILINDQPLSSLPLQQRRSLFSWVPQDVSLPHGTLRELLNWGLKETAATSATALAQEELLWEALRLARLEDFVRQLKNGLDTPAGDVGRQLSAGQRQRLSLARAWLRQSPIMLLDEATSALDSTNQELIYQALEQATSLSPDAPQKPLVGKLPISHDDRNATSLFLIAHRLSTIRLADTIVVMNNGQLVDYGDHPTLYKSCDLYYQLCQAEHFAAA